MRVFLLFTRELRHVDHFLYLLFRAQIARLQGVLRVTDPHFWKLQGDSIVGTAHVLVEDTVDEQTMRKHVTSLLTHCGVTKARPDVM